MLICLDANCICSHERLLDSLEKGLNEEAKLFLQKLKNISEITDCSGLTLLHYTVKYNNVEMTQHLIVKGCNIDAQDAFGVSPLMMAIKAKDVRTAEILIKNNADIYLANCDEISILEIALQSRCHSPVLPLKQASDLILEMLFDIVKDDLIKGKLIEILLNANDSLKLAIVVFGNVDIIEFVLKNIGYTMDYRTTKRQFTALHCAIRLSRFESAKILIEYGANVDAVDDYDWTPLHYYTTADFEEVDEESEVLKRLLRVSTSLTIRRKGCFTDVEHLFWSGKEKTIRTLLQNGINVNTSLNQGRSVQYFLLSNRNIDNIDMLTEFNIKFDVNEMTFERTALMTAVFCGKPKKVEFLLQHGADVNAITSYGKTTISEVQTSVLLSPEEESNLARILELLLQYGTYDDDVHSFFRERPSLKNKFSLLTKVIVAQLAILCILEQSSLTESSRKIIESFSLLKAYFDKCIEQLEGMKRFELYGTITLFKLLTDSEEKVVAYARNQQLFSSFNSEMGRLSHLEPYYLNFLRRKLSRSLDEAQLQENVALVIGTFTGLCVEAYQIIIFRIIQYLDKKDLENLYELRDSVQ